MPYNTTAIPPRKEVTGQPALPLARVKKIIAQDPDIGICSNNAAFIITMASEMFIQHLASEAQNMAKLDRKPRKNIQYKDLANAVAHHDNLEFLEDTIPKTVPYKDIKYQAGATRARIQRDSVDAAAGTLAAAATTTTTTNGTSGKKRRSSPLTTAVTTNGVHGHASSAAGEPGAQLEAGTMQASDADGDGDVSMTG
ncbi:histone-fold-containing protein [Sodiomyces alkalinus F11]|uniref:Histone-fold-containing protein n=1 Tax=Sodiomyces alkalinus (strain CBS 110278 / VKM F-3762 / F11) TaxID=1314773 RepID=A0A3N2Q1J5_SODAK|nr:histone-fold-containing protein [Sodiomyces alkalinus F11]ROT40629.1 histone-fold-containing protein [Sodiomyces alkalinus F11]